MRLLADECVSANIIKLLRRSGHDVLYVAETAAGQTDTDVVALAQREQRIVITEDKDFGDLAIRLRHAVPGLILLRIASGQSDLKFTRLETALEKYGDELVGHFLVVEVERMRRRPMNWIAPPLASDSG